MRLPQRVMQHSPASLRTRPLSTLVRSSRTQPEWGQTSRGYGQQARVCVCGRAAHPAGLEEAFVLDLAPLRVPDGGVHRGISDLRRRLKVTADPLAVVEMLASEGHRA